MIAHEIDYQIIGDDMQLVVIELDPQESVRAEAGAMLYMEQGIEMQTNATGGILGGLKRIVTGESFFITSFTNRGNFSSHVAFSAPYPGKIIPIDLSKLNGSIFCQKDAFLCAAEGIDIEVAFTKRIGTGLFGGEGFILQKLIGDGISFVHAGGTIIKKTLQVGDVLRVDTGCLVAFSTTINYNIQAVSGFKNALFGGEGLFLAELTGEGEVYLQSLPFSRLVDRIKAVGLLGNNRPDESKGLAGMFGSLISGD